MDNNYQQNNGNGWQPGAEDNGQQVRRRRRMQTDTVPALNEGNPPTGQSDFSYQQNHSLHSYQPATSSFNTSSQQGYINPQHSAPSPDFQSQRTYAPRQMQQYGQPQGYPAARSDISRRAAAYQQSQQHASPQQDPAAQRELFRQRFAQPQEKPVQQNAVPQGQYAALQNPTASINVQRQPSTPPQQYETQSAKTAPSRQRNDLRQPSAGLQREPMSREDFPWQQAQVVDRHIPSANIDNGEASPPPSIPEKKKKKHPALKVILILLLLLIVAIGGISIYASKKYKQMTELADAWGLNYLYEDSSRDSSHSDDGAGSARKDQNNTSAQATDNLFYVRAWQDELLFGSTSLDARSIYAMNTNGEFVYKLDPDVKFAINNFNDEVEVYNGQYALMKNDTVIDRNGRVVFDLQTSGFDSICHGVWLDAGYLMCEKKPQDFNQMASDYYAVNVATGNTYRFEQDFVPDVVNGYKYWRYLGNGYILLTEPTSTGYSSVLYNLDTKQKMQIVVTDAATGETTTNIEVNNNWEGFKDKLPLQAGQTRYNTVGYRYGQEGYYYELDLTTGQMVGKQIEFFKNNHIRPKIEKTDVTGVVMLSGTDDNKQYHTALMDLKNLSILPLDQYKKFTLIRQLENGDYGALITNEGDQQFLAVIAQDGTWRFNPLSFQGYYVDEHWETGVALKNMTEMVIVSWTGKLLATLDDETYALMGERSLVYKELTKQAHFVDLNTGTVTPMGQLLAADNPDKDEYWYETNGYYFAFSTLVDENGNVKILNVDPALSQQ